MTFTNTESLNMIPWHIYDIFEGETLLLGISKLCLEKKEATDSHFLENW